MIVRDQHNAARRQNAHQCLPDQLGVRIGRALRLRLSKSRRKKEASELHAASRSGPQPVRIAVGGCSGINLFRGGCEFGRGIVDHATSMHDVGKNARHYFSPPFAATNSRTLSAFSSLLPWSISAPLLAAGTK